MYECNDKMVSHPNHYQTKNGLEAITVIEAFTEELKGIEAVDTANVLRYILRWKKKNGVQDLRKAIFYIQHLIDHLEKEDALKRASDSLASINQSATSAATALSNMIRIE